MDEASKILNRRGSSRWRGASFMFVLTSLMGTCPLYLPFGLSTRGKSA